MRLVSPTFRFGVGLLALCTTLALGLSTAGRGTATVTDKNAKPRKYYGAGSCKKCHLQAQEGDDTDWAQLNEYTTWKNEDKHSKAFEVLANARALRMGENMGGIDVKEDHRCLKCHAMPFPQEERGDQFVLSDGVSCDGCHGPAQDWFGTHTQKDWRAKTGTEKLESGMNDVRDPVARTEMCLSCHMGSYSEDKWVTHEMYAAGHPPLPVFEIDTFSEKLPRHWRYAHSKKLQLFEAREMQVIYGKSLRELERLRLLLIGSVVAVRKAAHLAKDQSSATAAVTDFAQFDCGACHHDLKQPHRDKPSRRAERGYPGAPGRSLPRVWPTALVELAVLHTAQNEVQATEDLNNFKGHVQKLYGVFGSRPFGNPRADAVAEAAQGLGDWADELIAKLGSATYDQKAARKMLQQLCSLSAAAREDYDSARQIAWALDSIYNQIEPTPEHDTEVRRILTELKEELALGIPSGQQQQILEFLPTWLEAIGNYEPERFQSHLDALKKLLP